MLKGNRRPVTYGKTSKRYEIPELLDAPSPDAKAAPQSRRLWRGPSSPARADPSPSPEATGRRNRPKLDDFAVPSSDSEELSSRLARPSKKRKLTPPLAKPLTSSKSRLTMMRPKQTQAVRQLGPEPFCETVRASSGDFDVPSSGDERHQVKKKAVSTLSRREPTQKITSRIPDRNLARTGKQFSSSQISTSLSSSHDQPVNALLRQGRTQPKGFVGRSRSLLSNRPKSPPKESIVCMPTPGSGLLAPAHGLRPGYQRQQESSPDLGDTAIKSPNSAGEPYTPVRRDGAQSSPRATDPLSAHPAGFTPGALDSLTLYVRGEASPVERRRADGEQVPPRPVPNAESPRRKLKDRLGRISKTSDGADREDSSVLDPDIEARIFANPASQTYDGTPSMDHVSCIGRPNRTSIAEPSNGRRKVTYGRQRSHLNESQSEEKEDWSIPIDESFPQSSGRRLQFSTQPETQSSQETNGTEIPDDDDLPSERPLRSVHELRAAGGARRTGFLLDAIFDDIDAASSLSSARGAAFRLALKLLEPGFPEEFMRYGSLSKFFGLKNLRQDVFVGSMYTVALLQVLPLAPMAEFSDDAGLSMLLSIFNTLLGGETSLTKVGRLKKSNMSRVHQNDLSQVCHLLLKSGGLGCNDPDEITPQLVGLKAMDVVTRSLREAGYMRQLVSAATFEQISGILRLSFAESATRFSGTAVERLSLSVLESLSIGGFLGQHLADEVAADAAAENLMVILPSALSLDQQQHDEDISLFLRLCLNMTTKSARGCQKFANYAVVSAVTGMVSQGFERTGSTSDTKQRDLIIDNLVLGLGFVANLTEEVPESRSIFLKPSNEGRTHLAELVNTFRARHEGASTATTEWETKVNVAFGYLAVLLCSLCLDAKIRGIVAADLKDKTLMKLRQAMAEFTVFHRSISLEADGVGSDDDGDDAGPSPQMQFVERLQGILSALNTVCTA